MVQVPISRDGRVVRGSGQSDLPGARGAAIIGAKRGGTPRTKPRHIIEAFVSMTLICDSAQQQMPPATPPTVCESRVAEDKENVNPNSLRLQKQRRLAKARAAKKAAVPSAPAAATAPTAELSAPAASSAPAPNVEPRVLHASHNALKRELSSIVSPPLAEIQGRHTRFMSRTNAGRTGSSLRDGYVCGDEMMMMSDSSPSGPVIR